MAASNSTSTEMFLNETEERTFCIIVEDRRLYVSKESMALFSPVFKQMFYGSFKEAKENSVTLREKKFNDILELLHVLFPVPLKRPITYSNVENMINLADEYDIQQLRVDCENFLEKQASDLIVGNENVVKIVNLSTKLWFTNVIFKCIPYLCALPDAVFKPYRYSMPSKIVAAVYDAKYQRSLAYRHTMHQSRAKIHDCNECLMATDNYCKKCFLCDDCVKSVCPNYHQAKCSKRFTSTIEKKCGALACLCGLSVDRRLLED